MTSNENGVHANGKEKKPFSRLPSTILPVHYDIFLKPDLKNLTFEGKMSVKLRIQQETDKLICNAADLEISEVQVSGQTAKDVAISKDEET